MYSFKLTLCLISATLILGCSTNKGGYKTEESVERKILSMSKDQILLDLGPPTKKVDFSNGSESYRYESEVGGLTGGECTLTILFDGNRVTQAKLSANDLSWISFPLGSCTKIIQTLR